jgi:putative ABC transport system ATP-binding protein
MLCFEEVSLSYRVPDEEPVVAVKRVNAEVGAGEMVMIYGPSGSGKSTLLQLAAGLLTPDEGRVIVGGRDICTLKPRAAARYRMHELGFVTGFSNVMPAPAVENAALKLLGTGASWSQAEAEVTPLLERLGMGEKLARAGTNLSMGERQRVMIARALSNKPRLLLADEPTSNLDSHRSEEVLEVLRELCHDSGLAALIVTHDPQAAAAADRVHMLRDGHLLDYDPRAAAIALPG